MAGHTVDIPINTAQFRSNWELSSARAAAVTHELLMDDRLSPKRFSIQAFADVKPLAPNDSSENGALSLLIKMPLQNRPHLERSRRIRQNRSQSKLRHQSQHQLVKLRQATSLFSLKIISGRIVPRSRV